MRNFDDIVKTYVYKLWWRFREAKSLCANVLWKKYCKDQHPLDVVLPAHCSKIWRRMQSIKMDAEQHVFWIVGRGDIDAHRDRWLPVSLTHVPNLKYVHELQISK